MLVVDAAVQRNISSSASVIVIPVVVSADALGFGEEAGAVSVASINVKVVGNTDHLFETA